MEAELFNEIVYLINKKIEGDYWDYKQEWHEDNERLLHDILCLANTVQNKDSYIIIGIANNGEIIGLTENSPNRRKQADLLDMLSNLVFAGDAIPEITLETIIIRKKEIDVLTIFNSMRVPYYLKSIPKKYNSLVPGYIYSRTGDRNTPISQNSSINQIELLWKKRFGLLSPPLEQIAKRLKNKEEWQECNETYYNIFNPDLKLVEERNEDEYRHNKPEFYAYNQMNESTNYSELKVLSKETLLTSIQLVTLDGGRYVTPTPRWGFIHDVKYRTKVIHAYKYILKDSIDYVIQQFLYDEDNSEARIAKERFDEVVLYFDNEMEQQEFHNHIESSPNIIEQYLVDARQGRYCINSNNPLEVEDSKEKLITAFAFKRFQFDYNRKKSGIDVKRIISVKLVNESQERVCCSEVSKHQVEFNENGHIKHSLFSQESKTALEIYEYCIEKYRMRDFLNFLEPITTDWDNDYSEIVCDGYKWTLSIKYSDDSIKKVNGTVYPPPYSEDIEWRIKHITKYEVEPWLF